MSDFGRQRQALLSGVVKETVPVPAMNTLSSTVLNVPVGNPMDVAGTQRNAPMPYLSLYAGLRPHTDFISLRASGTLAVLIEVGIIPYVAEDPLEVAARSIRPLFVPLADAISVNVPTTFTNVLGARALLPWPPGSLQVRISFEWAMANDLGVEVDVCAAWCACSTAAYPSLPAAEDSRDLY